MSKLVELGTASVETKQPGGPPPDGGSPEGHN
jgi:hypothetical protein